MYAADIGLWSLWVLQVTSGTGRKFPWDNVEEFGNPHSITFPHPPTSSPVAHCAYCVSALISTVLLSNMEHTLPVNS